MPSALVLGSGLIGTSLGLALSAAGWMVYLTDVDPGHLQIAVGRGAGLAWNGSGRTEVVDVVVAAGPPTSIGGQLSEAQRLGLGQTYTHVASVQSQVQRQVEILRCDLSSIVGSHPLAGRETSGPSGAAADLFAGRPWALCPSTTSSPDALATVRALALACGAVPLVVAPDDHDRSVALLSHLPQVVASALAGQLVREMPDHAPAHEGPAPEGGAPSDVPSEPERRQRGVGIVASLSGTGLADTTRLAAGSPDLWTDILCANAGEVAPWVRALAGDLVAVATALESLADQEASSPEAPALTAARDVVTRLLRRGVQGRATVAVKRGVRDDGFARVGVDVDDRPGRLAALLTDAGRAGTNVEDVRVDHVPGRATGVIELLVGRNEEQALRRALETAGWRVLPGERARL